MLLETKSEFKRVLRIQLRNEDFNLSISRSEEFDIFKFYIEHEYQDGDNIYAIYKQSGSWIIYDGDTVYYIKRRFNYNLQEVLDLIEGQFLCGGHIMTFERSKEKTEGHFKYVYEAIEEHINFIK